MHYIFRHYQVALLELESESEEELAVNISDVNTINVSLMFVLVRIVNGWKLVESLNRWYLYDVCFHRHHVIYMSIHSFNSLSCPSMTLNIYISKLPASTTQL